MIEDDEAPGVDGNGEMDAEEEAAADEQAAAQQVQQPRIARTPREPTSEERRIHDITHIPMRPWCRHCMRRRCKDTYHVRLKYVEEVPRIGMDYTYLSEKGVTSSRDEAPEDPTESVTILVLKDFWHKSIWVYPVEGKGLTKSAWLPQMIIEDLKTCGLDSCMLVVKSDQEPAIKEVQEEIA